MADEAFALSPMSARSASPSDADYDAIQEAFMETARGRWFLGEYAKRNRNADTAMVLEAVARLEQSVAASRAEAKAAESQPAPEPVVAAVASPGPASDELLASIKAMLERTRASIAAALESPDLAATLEPLHSSARIIREIAWGLRESGADGRICNILDTQVRAIAAVCEALTEPEHRTSVLHIFDTSLEEIEELAQSGMPLPAEAIVPDAVVPDMDAAEMAVPVIDMPAMPAIATADQNVPGQDSASQETPSEETSSHEAVATKLPAVAIADDLIMETKAAPCLGDSLIAHGIVAPSNAATPDPLAPIRRMSQAEKIAFFS